MGAEFSLARAGKRLELTAIAHQRGRDDGASADGRERDFGEAVGSLDSLADQRPVGPQIEYGPSTVGGAQAALVQGIESLCVTFRG
jgi:hypothetical protein